MPPYPLLNEALSELGLKYFYEIHQLATFGIS